jgi:hypothetical protein
MNIYSSAVTTHKHNVCKDVCYLLQVLDCSEPIAAVYIRNYLGLYKTVNVVEKSKPIIYYIVSASGRVCVVSAHLKTSG